MAFTDAERRRHERLVAKYIERRRPPEELRDKIDLSFRIEGQSIVIFTIRPVWLQPDQKHESPAAKAIFVRTKNNWKVFWMRADLKWHVYPPKPTVKTLGQFLKLVEEDKYCCFWG